MMISLPRFQRGTKPSLPHSELTVLSGLPRHNYDDLNAPVYKNS